MHLLLVDGLNLIRRVHAAVPGEGFDAVETAIASSLHSLRRLYKQFQPTHGVCCFDGPELSWRHLEYSAYKEGRSPMPQELRDGLPSFREQFAEIGLSSLALATVEADDLAATLAAKMLSHGGQVTIVSTDKGFAQLLPLAKTTESLCLWDGFGRKEIDDQSVADRFGVEPVQLRDYWALAGDSTNNIPGVKGIGAKTAAKLLTEFGSIEKLFANIDQVPKGVASKLQDQLQQALFFRKILTLSTDLDVGCKLSDFRWTVQP